MSHRSNHRPRGRRPTSPASSSSASSDDDNNDTTHLTLIGTPIDTTERHYRTLRQQRTQQQQQHNTQQPATFTPATFVSSRQRRWEGEVATVEEYMDDKDVHEQTRDRLQVKADIEGGRSSRVRGGDTLLLAIAPRHETVARRILRRMGWREGGGVGKERQAGSSARAVNKRNRATRRPTVAAALPPSMQALLDEEEEETQLGSSSTAHDNESKVEHNPTTTDDYDDYDDDDDIDTPLPSDVPLYQPVHKDDYYGLHYDPLRGADEFVAHRVRRLQERHRREKEEAARDAAMVDDEDDEVVELVRGTAGRGGRGGRVGRRGGGVAGFRVMNDVDEMEDDEVEVYEDRAEYDTHIGRLKRDKQKQQKEEAKEEAEVRGGGGGWYGELQFVKSEVGGVSGGEVASVWDVPRDWNERKVWDEVEEATERERMKAVVREWADRRKAQQRARQDEVRQMQQQRNKDQQKEDERSERVQPQPPAVPSSSTLTAPPPVQSTADMLASGFFSRFTMGAATIAPSTLPLPLPPPPAPPAAFSIRQLTRQVLIWDPSPLLCRRLNVDPPPRRETNAANSTANQPASHSSRAGTQSTDQRKRGQKQQVGRKAVSEAAEMEASRLHAPVIVTERPPTAVLSAIFDDADDRGEDERARVAQQQWLEVEAMRLLSSIALPSNHTTSAAPSSASAATGLSQADNDRYVVSGYVHPSRQLQIPSTPLSTHPMIDSTLLTAAPSTLPLSSPSLAAPFTSTSTTVSGYVHPSRLQQLLISLRPPASSPPLSASTVAGAISSAVFSHPPYQTQAANAGSGAVASPAPRRSRWGERVDTASAPLPLPPSSVLSPSASPPPLGPPTPPSLHRSLPSGLATAVPAATTVLNRGSDEQKVALKAELLKELAVLEQQSERERKERKERHKEKRRERKAERRHSHSSGRRDGSRDKDRGGERRHSRRSRHDSSDSGSWSEGSSVPTTYPLRGPARSKRETDVVDLT